MQVELNSIGPSWYVAEVFLLALAMAACIFVFDLLFFRNVEALISALFFESLAMMLAGAAGCGVREHDFFTVGWKRAKTIQVDHSPRYLVFWLSVAAAGLLLILADPYLFGPDY